MKTVRSADLPRPLGRVFDSGAGVHALLALLLLTAVALPVRTPLADLDPWLGVGLVMAVIGLALWLPLGLLLPAVALLWLVPFVLARETLDTPLAPAALVQLAGYLFLAAGTSLAYRGLVASRPPPSSETRLAEPAREDSPVREPVIPSHEALLLRRRLQAIEVELLRTRLGLRRR